MPKTIEKKKLKSEVIDVDFSGVQGRDALPEDNYAVKVAEIDVGEGDKGKYLQFVLEVIQGHFKGRKIWMICSLSPKSLWNLKTALEAMGIDVPDSLAKIRPQSYLGLTFGVTTEIEVFNKKERTRVVDTFPLEEEDEEGEEESGETPKEEGEKGKDEEGSPEEEPEEVGEGDEEEPISPEDAEKTWDGLKPKERTAKANEAGLEGKFGKKLWADLEDEEKSTLYPNIEEPEEEETDLDSMNLEQLVAYAEENEISLTKKESKSKNLALKALKELEEE